jgi:hypothetical protein
MVQKMLSHKEISKNVYLTGSIDSLSIAGVTLTDRAIKAILLAKGTLNVMAHD